MEVRPLSAVQKKQSAELESTGVMPVINSEEGPEERHRYRDRLLQEVACLQSFYMAQSYQKKILINILASISSLWAVFGIFIGQKPDHCLVLLLSQSVMLTDVTLTCEDHQRQYFHLKILLDQIK